VINFTLYIDVIISFFGNSIRSIETQHPYIYKLQSMLLVVLLIINYNE
jgi:hypothetical protein